jgi:hypothetical protein
LTQNTRNSTVLTAALLASTRYRLDDRRHQIANMEASVFWGLRDGVHQHSATVSVGVSEAS